MATYLQKSSRFFFQLIENDGKIIRPLRAMGDVIKHFFMPLLCRNKRTTKNSQNMLSLLTILYSKTRVEKLQSILLYCFTAIFQFINLHLTSNSLVIYSDAQIYCRKCLPDFQHAMWGDHSALFNNDVKFNSAVMLGVRRCGYVVRPETTPEIMWCWC